HSQGTGGLGALVVQRLLQAGRFNITILSRRQRGDVPHGAKLVVIDYNDQSSLVKALQGQDAIVSALSRDATLLQLPLIDAGVIAGVKRFVPSEFGGNLQNPNTRQLPNYKNKVRVEEYLEEKAKTHGITYTYIYNNVFLDWSIENGMLIDLKRHHVPLYDGGERAISLTRMPTAAQAVERVLTHHAQTKNRSVCIHEVCLSQRQLLSLAKEAIPAAKWREEHVDLQKLEQVAKDHGKQGVPNISLFHAFAVKGGFGEGYGNQFSDADNKLLGIEPLSVESIKEILADGAKKHE
ncbi:hypothetical protein BKA56DRAFT_697029, partial [Ilyonectria sp. MPI-CAGE-AT-0026]